MGRISKRITQNKLVVFFIMVLGVLLLPIILPIALIQDRQRKQSIKQVVCGYICASCGVLLGVEAIRLGNERWAAVVSDSHKQYPNIRFRIQRDVHAVCPNCGCEYGYRDADCALVVRPHHESA